MQPHIHWDSPGKNTGVGCHFLLQCMKVKSEREVTQSCPTLSNPMDCSLPDSSIHGIFQARVLEWGARSQLGPSKGRSTFSVLLNWCLLRWQADSLPLSYQVSPCTFFFFGKPYYLWAEKAMAPHSSTLAWKIPWMEESGRLQSMGLLRVGHDWATSLSLFSTRIISLSPVTEKMI